MKATHAKHSLWPQRKAGRHFCLFVVRKATDGQDDVARAVRVAGADAEQKTKLSRRIVVSTFLKLHAHSLLYLTSI